MTVRLAERECGTFDVYAGATFVGSVWPVRDGWAVYDRGLCLVAVEMTAELAAARLAGVSA